MPTSRRDFIKGSLLAGASAAAGKVTSAKAAADLPGAVSPAFRPAAEGGLQPDGQPLLARPLCRLVPYGSGEPVYRSDLDRCRPASALATSWEPRRWKLYPFETDGVKGTLIAAGQNSGVPDVEYTLPERGWHAIYFGILSQESESRLQVRFKEDEVFCLLTPNNLAEAHLMWDDIQWSKHSYNSPGIEDLFWRYAELDPARSTLVFRQLKTQLLAGDPDTFGNIFHPCWLAYIKLVPLSPPEVETLKADRRRRDTRRLFAADDAFTPSYFLHFQTEDDVRRQIEPYRDTDFSRLYWEAGAGDLTYYPSAVGRLNTFGWTADQYPRGDRLFAQTMTDFHRRGIDPFSVALDYSHQIGLEFHASYRVAGFKFPPPDDEWNTGGLYEKHPEWRSLDRSGRATPRLSYAFPEVREFVLSLQEEVVRRYPVDGICLLYNRRLPVIGYDPPLVEAFKARHGIDPRTVSENDPRWLAAGAAVLSDFMRQLRRRMRAEASRQGRGPVGITAVVAGSREENAGYGLDLESWVREDLIDTLVPYSSVRGGDSHLPSWDDPKSAAFFINLVRGTPCKLALNLLPRGITPEDYKRRADALYRAGAENFFVWDCFDRINFDPSWTTLARLGHRDELAAWRGQGSPRVERPRAVLRRLGDWNLGYATPG